MDHIGRCLCGAVASTKLREHQRPWDTVIVQPAALGPVGRSLPSRSGRRKPSRLSLGKSISKFRENRAKSAAEKKKKKNLCERCGGQFDARHSDTRLGERIRYDASDAARSSHPFMSTTPKRFCQFGTACQNSRTFRRRSEDQANC